MTPAGDDVGQVDDARWAVCGWEAEAGMVCVRVRVGGWLCGQVPGVPLVLGILLGTGIWHRAAAARQQNNYFLSTKITGTRTAPTVF